MRSIEQTWADSDDRTLEGASAPRNLDAERTLVEEGRAPSIRPRFGTDPLPPPASGGSPSSGTLVSGPQRPPAEDGPEAQVPIEGALLGGVYRVIGRLSAWEMGVVLLARDEQLQRRVAIKLLRPDKVDRAMQARLLDEARAMARVHHPNVVEIYAFGEHGAAHPGAAAAPYLVMEYVEGPTLDEHVRGRGGAPMALDEALSLLDAICLGVAAIHAAGVVHRDLWPKNILIGPASRVAVADLGLARDLAGDERAQRSSSGAPAYVAPEIALRRPIDPALLPRVDVYALGVMAYWLLTGRLPFEGEGALDPLEPRARRAAPRPSEIRPDLPPSFDAPLLAALAEDPAERTESVEAFREALLAARDEAPISLAPMRVVVADDDLGFRALITDILEAALPGARVEAVADGAAALAAIVRDPPALGVFDIDMPGIDGIALTAAVRALPRGGDFPIVVATGSGGAAEWQRLARLGASAFLVKPFDAGRLMTVARGLVGIEQRDAPARSGGRAPVRSVPPGGPRG